MPRHKFPPRGYRMQEYPLPHNFTYNFFLNMENETQNSTILTLFRTSEAAVGVENVEVNPRHANFAEDGGCVIHTGSIVPKISLSILANIGKNAIETDKLQHMRFSWTPLYISFLNSLEAADEKTGVQIEDILELQHDVTNKDTYPLFSTTDLAVPGTQPMSTVPLTEVFGDIGLTVDTKLESVAYDEDLFYDAMSYYTNSAMLRKVTGKTNIVNLSQSRMYRYTSNRFTYPSVKRGNPYTFCGILFHVPQVGSAHQFADSTETTDVATLHVGVQVRFDEWNPNFDQTAL